MRHFAAQAISGQQRVLEMGRAAGQRERRRDCAGPPHWRIRLPVFWFQLVHEMIKRDARKGLATLCIGGGQGVCAGGRTLIVPFTLPASQASLRAFLLDFLPADPEKFSNDKALFVELCHVLLVPCFETNNYDLIH